MDLLRITSIPIEYKLNIKLTELQLAEAAPPRTTATKSPTAAVNTETEVGLLEKSGSDDIPKDKIVNTTEDSHKSDSEKKFFGDANDKNKTDLIERLSENPEDVVQKKENEKEKFDNRVSVTEFIDAHRKNLQTAVVNKYDKFSKIVNNQKLDNIREAYIQSQKKLEVIPGSVEMEVLTKPEVKVEYIGGFMYVPPEANPDYKEPFYEEFAV